MGPTRPGRPEPPDRLARLPRAEPAAEDEGPSLTIRKAEPVDDGQVLRATPVRRSLAGAVDRKTAQLVEIRALMQKAARLDLEDP